MKILAIADMDDIHWNGGYGGADLLVSCGDVADQVILQAAEAYGCREIFAVKGNHDSAIPFTSPIFDLHLQVTECCGLTFGGFNGCWKYKPKGHFLYTQQEAEDLLRDFPRVDVLVTHNSPHDVHDRPDNVHIGFDALNAYIRRAKPRLLIHGHQHVTVDTDLNGTRVHGVYGHEVIELEVMQG